MNHIGFDAAFLINCQGIFHENGLVKTYSLQVLYSLAKTNSRLKLPSRTIARVLPDTFRRTHCILKFPQQQLP